MDPRALSNLVTDAIGGRTSLTVSESLGAGADTMFKDAWRNSTTNLGVEGKDKRLGAVVQAASLDYDQLGEAYRGDDMVKSIIDIPAAEMTRCWADCRIEGKEKQAEEIGALLDLGLNARETFRLGTKWKRLYGGAAILIGVEDGQPLDKPVNEASIKSVKYLNVFDPSECRPIAWQFNAAKADYGEPTMYQIYPRVFGVGAAHMFEKVHASRVIRMNGVVANRAQATYNNGWGDSILDACFDAIRDFAQAFHGTSALLQDFAQGVFKLRGLAAAMGSDREKLIMKRLQLIDFCRSMLRSVVIDAEGEDFERKTTSVAGLDGILDRMSIRLAGAARIPMAKLFCETPGGMSNGGLEGPLELWHKEINADQVKELSPGLMKITRYVMLCPGSPTKGKVPKNFSWEWRPLSELSQKEEADMHLSQAQADQIYMLGGVLGPETIRTNRFGGDRYSLATSIPDGPEQFPAGPEATVTRLDDEGHPIEVKPGATSPEAGKPTTEGTATAPAAAGAKGKSGGLKAQDTALNGTQISSALQILKDVASEQIPRASGVQALVSLLYMDPVEAEKLMGEIGKGFTPKPPEPSPDTVHSNETKVALAQSKPEPKAA